jgi:hypothetical protein
MGRLLFLVVVLAGLFYVARQHGGGIGRLFGPSPRALSRVEKPLARAVSEITPPKRGDPIYAHSGFFCRKVASFNAC